MNENAIYHELNKIFRNIFDDDSLVVTPDTSAKDIPEWDSFNHINITVASELRFGVKFRSSELDELQSVGDFVQLIRQKLATGSPV